MCTFDCDENLVSTIFPMQACATETCGDTASDLLRPTLHSSAVYIPNLRI